MPSQRKLDLVEIAKMRAKVLAIVGQVGGVVPFDAISKQFDDAARGKLQALMYRMVDSGLLNKIPIEHPDYKYGYALPNELPLPPKKSQAAASETPIDVRINKRKGSITIRYAGLLITLSKED
jgi:hypothetical protein